MDVTSVTLLISVDNSMALVKIYKKRIKVVIFQLWLVYLK